MNIEVGRRVAHYLLKSGAAHFNFDQPYRWTSGWLSPVYMDNRLLLSIVEARDYVIQQLIDLIEKHYPKVEVIAGVATAGIPNASIIADRLKLPLIYVRSEAKKHGLGRQIEGRFDSNSTILVIEDLVSTGESSLRAIEAIRNANGIISGLIATFTYGFDQTVEAFDDQKITFYSLSNFADLITESQAMNLVTPQQLTTLETWYKQPNQWLNTSKFSTEPN